MAKLLILDCRLPIEQLRVRAAERFPANQQFWNYSYLQASLNLARQRAEVGHSLQFVVRKLDMKMILQFRQQIECLQAVNAERLEEIIVGREFLAGHFEVGCGEIEYLG